MNDNSSCRQNRRAKPQNEGAAVDRRRASYNIRFVLLPFSAGVASGARFGTLPGSVLGAFWPSRWLKPLLEFLLERPRAVQEHFFPVPEPSKSAPRGLQDRSKRPPRAEERLQDGSKTPLGIDFKPPGTFWDTKINDFQGPQGNNFGWPGALCKTSKSIP